MTEQERYFLSGYELESPLINAAGSINGPYPGRIFGEMNLLADTGIGAITVGSFTVPAQSGNEAKYGSPTYYYDSVEGKTYNSMGLPNIGFDDAVRFAPDLIARAHVKGKRLIYSGSPTISPGNGNSIDQARMLAYEFLQTNVDMVELNVSCPNVVTESGGRKPMMGYDIDTMEELVDELAHEVGEGQRLGIKMPPYISEEEKLIVPEIAKLLRTKRVFKFLVTSNTIPNQIALDQNEKPILSVPEGKGGMSGPATKEIGREQARMWVEQLGGELDVVSALGVDSGQEIRARRSIGAVAASGVTFLWESGDWAAKVTSMLQEYADSAEPETPHAA